MTTEAIALLSGVTLIVASLIKIEQLSAKDVSLQKPELNLWAKIIVFVVGCSLVIPYVLGAWGASPAFKSLLSPQPSTQSGKLSFAKSELIASTDGTQVATRKVEFPVKFRSKPVVAVFPMAFDASKDTNFRMRLDVVESSITNNGFTVQISTWADTHFTSIGVGWFASEK